jgi:protein-S-isoprenylcysteine O-methyltransferase Ste14
MRRAAVGSAVFFVVAPCVVAGLVPWLLTGWEAVEPLSHRIALRLLGGGLVLAAGAVLVHSFARFVVEGRGTPAPVAPPQRLVVGGLYRHVRNPMYLAVTGVILGQAPLLWQSVLAAYGAIVFVIFNAFVLVYEEPALTAQFGAEYRAYREAVPRWLPRPKPWTSEHRA